MVFFWDFFIDRYKIKLADLTLRQILEMFFYYVEDGVESSDDILKKLENEGE